VCVCVYVSVLVCALVCALVHLCVCTCVCLGLTSLLLGSVQGVWGDDLPWGQGRDRHPEACVGCALLHGALQDHMEPSRGGQGVCYVCARSHVLIAQQSLEGFSAEDLEKMKDNDMMTVWTFPFHPHSRTHTHSYLCA
jgi:hypothetical protein